ncbi:MULTISPECIES: ABC transporter ATP-binding protein [Pseudonocardia]|nr:ABC transporter ATP-binding protein [Pseudonocardia dioxanivorans]
MGPVNAMYDATTREVEAPVPDESVAAAATPDPAPPELVVRGLRKTYEAETAPVRALRGVDLTVGRGEFVALMGPSGSGKSTLLHLLAGLDRADEGSVSIAGIRTEELSATRLARLRRRHVGLVFQFFHLIDHMSALENVALAALVAGAKPAEATERARDLLDTLGLLEKAGESPANLSGGQRQRVAIARALANRPTLLLADEPTGALDSDGAAEVLDLFTRMHRVGQTILMVTHSADVAAGAQRIVRMRDGVLLGEIATTGEQR